MNIQYSGPFESATGTIVAASYHSVASNYDDVEPLNNMRLQDLLRLSGIQHGSSADVLDLGCGDGQLAYIVAQRTSGCVTTIDIANGMANAAHTRLSTAFDAGQLSARSVWPIVGNIFQFETIDDLLKYSLILHDGPPGWDVIFMSRVEHHCRKIGQHLAVIANRLLRPNGRIVIDYLLTGFQQVPMYAHWKLNNSLAALYRLSPVDGTLDTAARDAFLAELHRDQNRTLEIDSTQPSMVWDPFANMSRTNAINRLEGPRFATLRSYVNFFQPRHQTAHQIIRPALPGSADITTFAQYRTQMSNQNRRDQAMLRMRQHVSTHPSVQGVQDQLQQDFEEHSFMAVLKLRDDPAVLNRHKNMQDGAVERLRKTIKKPQ
jgi:SAM-dependent methyltransferase